jgi:predicted enzyme related to lactoylglutathione lyase
MSAENARNGNFEWRDITTTDPEKAKAFYTGLFGWTVAPADMEGADGYEIFSNNGTMMGGIVGIAEGDPTPSHWLSYLTVDDFDGAVARVPELGGKVIVAPSEIMPGVGRWSIVSDPSGASFALFAPDYPADPSVTDHLTPPPVGGITWNEVSSDNVEAAKAFYGGVVGWNFQDQDMGGMIYTLIRSGSRDDAGLMQKMPDAPFSSWTIYFRVANIEESVAKINELGGGAFPEVIEVPGIGRMTWAHDPTGAWFAIHETVSA